MIDKKGLYVGLRTIDGKVVTAIGRDSLFYTYVNNNKEYETSAYIEDFCRRYVMRTKTVKITQYANVRKDGTIKFYRLRSSATLDQQKGDIAVAVELRGSYEA